MKISKKLALISGISLGLLGVYSCSSDDDGAPQATFTFDSLGLQPLSGGLVYQGWLIVDGEAKPTKQFTDPDKEKEFLAVASDLEDAEAFLLTIENSEESGDREPSETRILRGSFSGNTANLSFEEVVTSLDGNDGTFVMETPTDGEGTNENSGVWFIDKTKTPIQPGLTLNPIKAGWVYEGWVVIDNIPVSTGTFTDPAQKDKFNSFSATTNDAYAYPGEDFLNNAVAPDGLTFPTDLKGAQVVISIEPANDKDPLPFFLKPLSGSISSTDASGEQISMISDSGSPRAQVKR